MPYLVVFTNGEKRELVVEADTITYESSFKSMVFRDREGNKMAYVPVDGILYVKKTDE